ncbi:hypothetical protein SAMN04488543_0602 [Friedmanniella luteola]|uniref:Fibronectin type-III domain-containing protein n=1 Tax=Friedmanniella luteola TaxID=546871 RepID=A0A1H1MCF4_9ACTN|nr:hypothetical protein SAMN04488543_0602 [Friedmanniella luteola]
MTVRRLLVFGVCALGVASLYLVPGIARSPHQTAVPRQQDQPTARPSGTVVREVAVPTSASTGAAPRPSASAPPAADDATSGPAPSPLDDRAADAGPAEPSTTAAPRPRPSRTGATAFDPAAPRDDEAPEPVADITSATVTPSRLTLRWPAAADNVGVVEYKVVLNGYQVASTPDTSATVRWFNDDARDHIVQVRAVDAAGNESPSSPNLLVARPTPGPTPEPTPTPEPSETAPTPVPTPEPTPQPSATTTAPSQDDEPQGEDVPGDAEPLATPTDEEN